MPKEATLNAKKEVISEIKGKLDKAVSAVLVDARGLTVEQDTILRKRLREAEVDYKVYKNSMIDLAVKDTRFEGLSEYLAGPTTLAISYIDATGAASILNKFKKEKADNDKVKFKASFMDGSIYDAAMTQTLASIPSREELLSKLLGSFKSPMGNFARVINQIAAKAEPSEA